MGVTEGLTDPDAVPEPPDDPITQPGDIWVLGDHRLMCGDSGSAADLDKLLDGATIDLVNMDPPYNVRVEPRSNNAIAAGLSSFSMPEGHSRKEKKFDAQGKFIRRYLPELARLPDAALHAPWDAKPMELMAAGVALGKTYPHRVVRHDEARERTLQRYAVVRKTPELLQKP